MSCISPSPTHTHITYEVGCILSSFDCILVLSCVVLCCVVLVVITSSLSIYLSPSGLVSIYLSPLLIRFFSLPPVPPAPPTPQTEKNWRKSLVALASVIGLTAERRRNTTTTTTVLWCARRLNVSRPACVLFFIIGFRLVLVGFRCVLYKHVSCVWSW